MRSLESSFDALKQLISIIMGIAIGNVMIESFKHLFHAHVSSDPLLAHLKIGNVDYLMLGFSLTLLAVRFYHGNIRTLDEAAEVQSSEYESSSLGRFLDFVAIILQGSIFSVLGMTLENRETLWITLLLLLLSDVFLAATGFLTLGKLSHERQRWVFINLFSVIMLSAGKLFNLPFMPFVILTLVVGSVVDYLLNWDFYFPQSKTNVE